LGGDATADKGAGKNADDDFAHHLPVHRAALVVGAEAGHGGKHDAGQRCAQRQVHDHGVGNALPDKTEHQHGNDDQAATDAQQAGQDPGNAPTRMYINKMVVIPAPLESVVVFPVKPVGESAGPVIIFGNHPQGKSKPRSKPFFLI
jgi:hypothetical protein